jgi:surface antigen
MKSKLILGVALLALAAPASAMPVSTFLVKADALQKKGPLAVFSGDLKLLMNQIKSDSAQLRDENRALAAAGKRKAYCTPAGGVSLTNQDVLGAMQAVPVPQRASTSTKQAMRSYLARRYPCPA